MVQPSARQTSETPGDELPSGAPPPLHRLRSVCAWWRMGDLHRWRHLTIRCLMLSEVNPTLCVSACHLQKGVNKLFCLSLSWKLFKTCMSCMVLIWKHGLSHGFQMSFFTSRWNFEAPGVWSKSPLSWPVSEPSFPVSNTAFWDTVNQLFSHFKEGKFPCSQWKPLVVKQGLHLAQEALGNIQCLSEIRENLNKAKAYRASMTYTLTKVIF